MKLNLTFRQCMPDDVHTLRNFSDRTYYETFAHMNTPSNMKAYLEQSFNIDKLRCELSNSDSLFYFLYADGELAGYLKLNEAPSQTDINDLQSIEIERIYVAKEFQGEGLGNVLMNKAINIANSRNKLYVWLGVWEKTTELFRFIKRTIFMKLVLILFLWETKSKQML
jgi:diamine N-acetyltransferase